MSKIIAVTGSPNSGKTATALKIARNLGEKTNPETGEKFTVAYVSTDFTVPALPSIFPCRKVLRSVSVALEPVEINRGALLSAAMTIDKVDNIIYFGFKDGENKTTFPIPSPEKADKFYINLLKIVDYIVVDCTSFIDDNELTSEALRISDKTIITYGYNLKAMAYFGALEDKDRYKFDDNSTIKCMVLTEDVRKLIPVSSVAKTYGGMDYIIPYTQEIKQQEIEGNLSYLIKDKKYNSIIQDITDKIVDVHSKKWNNKND